MAVAYRILGAVLLVSGVAAFVVPTGAQGSTFLKYLFGVVALLSAAVLIRGAPEKTAPSGPLPEAGPEVEDLVRRGDVIPAIKRYREAHGVGLKEAKDAIDGIRARLRGND